VMTFSGIDQTDKGQTFRTEKQPKGKGPQAQAQQLCPDIRSSPAVGSQQMSVPLSCTAPFLTPAAPLDRLEIWVRWGNVCLHGPWSEDEGSWRLPGEVEAWVVWY
jgi:hypothetical protein